MQSIKCYISSFPGLNVGHLYYTLQKSFTFLNPCFVNPKHATQTWAEKESRSAC